MNKTEMLLSIIIPVYNVEPYIERCLRSYITQKNVESNSYEIIIVNDGTPDNSFDIAKKILSNCPNAIFLNQENQGLSVARNNGLLKAKGEYVWFIDSDDWIQEDALENIFPMLKNKIDLLQLNHRLVNENGEIENEKIFCINGIISGRTQLLVAPLPTPAQFTIYRREFLLDNNLKFVKGIYHEDCEFKPRVLYKAEKVASLSKIVYNYFKRSTGSITSSYKLKNAYDTIYVLNSLYNFSKGLPDQYRHIFYNIMGLNLNSILSGLRQLSFTEKIEIQKEIIQQKHIILSISKSKNFKYKLEGLTLMLFPNLFFKLYPLLKILTLK